MSDRYLTITPMDDGTVIYGCQACAFALDAKGAFTAAKRAFDTHHCDEFPVALEVEAEAALTGR